MRPIKVIDPFGFKHSIAKECLRDLHILIDGVPPPDCPFEVFAESCLEAILIEGPMPMIYEKNQILCIQDKDFRRAAEIMEACVTSMILYDDLIKRELG